MPALLARLRASRSWWFDLAVCCVGIGVLLGTAIAVVEDGFVLTWPAAIGIPLIVVVARFPIILETRDGGIEVGFDSSLLMFLLSTLDTHDALLAWSVGVVLTQLTSSKRVTWSAAKP